jgi:glycosyltransferase 2 family protein
LNNNISPATDNYIVKKRRSAWPAILTVLLAVVLLYFTLHDLDWKSFWEAIRNGRYEILLFIIPTVSLNYFIRATRWSVFIHSEKKVPVISIFWANMIGYMGNAYLPARAGEILRSVFLGREKQLGVSFVLATALTERILDVIALVIIGSVAILGQNSIPSELQNAVWVTAGIGVTGLIFILVMPYQEKLVFSVLNKLPLHNKFRVMLNEQISRFLIGMRSLQNAKRLISFIALTIIIWLVDALINVISVHIIGQNLNIGQALILLAALGLSSAIPSTPGYIGVYQFVAVIVLVPFGFSRSDALAYILISQILSYGIITFWGLIGLWQINKARDFTSLVKDISTDNHQNV